MKLLQYTQQRHCAQYSSMVGRAIFLKIRCHGAYKEVTVISDFNLEGFFLEQCFTLLIA